MCCSAQRASLSSELEQVRSELEAAREEWALADKAAKEHDKRQAQVIADLSEQVGSNTPSQPPGSQPPLEPQNDDDHRLTSIAVLCRCHG